MKFWGQQKSAAEGKDMERLSQFFGPNSQLFTLAGGRLEGRITIRNFWEKSLAGMGPGATLTWKRIDILPLSENSATLHGQWEVAEATLPENYPNWGYFLQTLQKRDGKWQIQRAHFWSVGEGHTRNLRPSAVP